MNYDSILFIEIIESVQGITFIRDQNEDGIYCKIYEGLNGRMVIIDITDEFISDSTIKGHLIRLGAEYLIDSLFPTSDERENN